MRPSNVRIKRLFSQRQRSRSAVGSRISGLTPPADALPPSIAPARYNRPAIVFPGNLLVNPRVIQIGTHGRSGF
jgi:hypothetical protein